MEYILNKTPIKTSNNFKINDVKIDIALNETNFDALNIEALEYDKLKIKTGVKTNFKSRIGLPSSKYYSLEINVLDKLNDNVYITYDFNDNKAFLADLVKLNLKKDSDSNFIIIFTGNNTCLHNFKLCINAESNSKSNISIINLINKDSSSFVAIENEVFEKAQSTVNFIDLGGSLRVSNYFSNLNGNNSINKFNNIYMGSDNDRIDMNFYIKNKGEKSLSTILCEGTLDCNSYKTFKGTIDFIKGSCKSIGEESENCILLSDKCKSRSLPMLLCGEEDVIGSHGVSSGKIDSNTLFYLMSRGIDESLAKKMIVCAKFYKIIDNIPDSSIKDKILEEINNRI